MQSERTRRSKWNLASNIGRRASGQERTDAARRGWEAGRDPPGAPELPRGEPDPPPAPAPSRVGRGTHGGGPAGGRGWAASALQSGAPLRGVSAGGRGAESRSQQGFYGSPSPRQEGPRAITFG